MNVSKELADKIFMFLAWLLALALVFIVIIKFKFLAH